MIAEGRAWVFGDDVDTDLLAPGAYMKSSPEELARHCLEALAPQFAAEVETGDIVVAGDNFGIGSSREQAAESLKRLGVGAVLARSFGGIFYRNAINLGLPALRCERTGEIRAGERLRLDVARGRLECLDRGVTLECSPLPPRLLAMVGAGGLIAHLQARFANPEEPS